MRIELLYFDGCPHREHALDLVHTVVDELGIRAELHEIEITSVDDVDRHGFLGSPTVRVNGVDIEFARREDKDFAFSCRRYGGSGVPPRELLLRALNEDRRLDGAKLAGAVEDVGDD